MNKDKLSFDLVKAIKKANNQILKQESEIIRKYGLTTLQCGVLECLYLKGDMRINDLIERLISTSGTMTVVIRNLEKAGYITKKNFVDDRRACIITLTENGKKLIKEILPKKQIQINDFADTLTDEEKAELLSLLYKFKERYKKKNG